MAVFQSRKKLSYLDQLLNYQQHQLPCCKIPWQDSPKRSATFPATTPALRSVLAHLDQLLKYLQGQLPGGCQHKSTQSIKLGPARSVQLLDQLQGNSRGVRKQRPAQAAAYCGQTCGQTAMIRVMNESRPAGDSCASATTGWRW